MRPDDFVATTLAGLEEVLAAEIKELGGENVRILRRAVAFNGGTSLLYKLNFSLRTAIRILLNIKTIRLSSESDLYNGVYQLPWQDYFKSGKTIAVKAAMNSSFFDNSHYVELKVKDAIVDKLRDKTGRRPDVNAREPDISIHVHLHNKMADISLDSSGIPLFKRGYRLDGYEAPLNEVLAAGMILMTGWKGDSDFMDPMCGSGTLAIEAAMIAKGIPPGVLRKSFAFQNWLDYDESLYHRVVENLMVSREFKHKVYASDISADALRAAGKNVREALLEDVIDLSRKDFFETRPVSGDGMIVLNPPYGERIIQENINDFYEKIGNHLKSAYPGYKAWILSANHSAIRYIGLKPFRKISLLNGKLDCRYLGFDLFRGKRADFLSALQK